MAARGAISEDSDKYFPGTSQKRHEEEGTRDAAKVNVPGESKADILVGAFDICIPSRRHGHRRSEYLTISSEHFRVAYPADVDRRSVNQILNTLESARNDYLRRASSASRTLNIPSLEIRLNESTGTFTSRTGQPWWAAAATKDNRIEFQPVGLLTQRGILLTTLRHELAHVIIDSVSNKHVPRWLQEGFALYLAGEGQTISRYLTRARLSEDELEQRLKRPRTRDEMRNLYAQAYLAVAETIRR